MFQAMANQLGAPRQPLQPRTRTPETTDLELQAAATFPPMDVFKHQGRRPEETDAGGAAAESRFEEVEVEVEAVLSVEETKQ